MKTIKVSEATGPALDWLVAKCEALKLHRNALLDGQIREGWWVSGYYMDPNNWTPLSLLNFSTDWAQGGPIIEREIDNYERRIGYFYANRFKRHQDRVNSDFSTTPGDRDAWATGPTLLIAAMRCFCCSKLGDVVDIPEELCHQQNS